MKFALNYSENAATLLQAGKIKIDLFKCPDWEDLVPIAAQLKPVYVHFGFQAGAQGVESEQLDAVQRWLDRTETRLVNTHINPVFENLHNPDDVDEVIALVVSGITPLVERFGAKNVIAENIPYPETKTPKPILGVDAAVITRVIEASGCGLLLDLGHARRTAEHLAIDPKIYISQLPVHRLREVHITGLGYNHDGRRCDHMPMREEDWELLAWALEQIRSGAWAEPAIVACEYGGVGGGYLWRSDPEVLATQIPRMYDMIYAAQPAY